MKELTGCRHITSDQHEIKQVRHSAVSRNTEDMRKFEEFCVARYLLNVGSMAVLCTELKNVASGLQAMSRSIRLKGFMGAKSIDAYTQEDGQGCADAGSLFSQNR